MHRPAQPVPSNSQHACRSVCDALLERCQIITGDCVRFDHMQPPLPRPASIPPPCYAPPRGRGSAASADWLDAAHRLRVCRWEVIDGLQTAQGQAASQAVWPVSTSLLGLLAIPLIWDGPSLPVFDPFDQAAVSTLWGGHCHKACTVCGFENTATSAGAQQHTRYTGAYSLTHCQCDPPTTA